MHYKARQHVSWDDGLAWRGLWRVNWQQLGAMINVNLNFWERRRMCLWGCIGVCTLLFVYPSSLMQFGLWSLLFSFGLVYEHWHARTSSEILFSSLGHFILYPQLHFWRSICLSALLIWDIHRISGHNPFFYKLICYLAFWMQYW